MREILRWAAPAALLVVVATAAGLPLLALRLRRQDPRHAVYSTAVDVALVASLAVVIALTVVFEEGGPGEVRLVPFSKILASIAAGDREAIREGSVDVILNVALFVPLGVAVALRSRPPSWSRFLVAVILLSVSVEVTQALVLTGRTADSTDVVTNVSGALLGFGGAVFASSWLPRDLRPDRRRAA